MAYGSFLFFVKFSWRFFSGMLVSCEYAVPARFWHVAGLRLACFCFFMKILFLYSFPLWGNGSGTYIRNSVQELVRWGYKIGIVAPDDQRFLEDKIRQYRVKPPQVPVFVGHPALKGAKRYSELSEREITEIYKSYLDTTLEAIANFEPDLIHVHHLSMMTWVARYVSALYGIKYVITMHGTGLTNILLDRRYLPLSRDAVAHARAITAGGGHNRSRFLKEFGRGYAKQTYIVPGGVDMQLFPLQRKVSTAFVRKYKLKDKKMVLFSGRLTSEKGAKYVIDAAKDIKGEVFLAGEGPQKKYLSELIARKGLKNVHLLGHLHPDKLVDFYYRADVLVAPSVVDEALGLSLLESMAASTPVVATRKGGIPLLLKHGHNGLFVKARNATNIATACNRLLADDGLREKMGGNARKTVETKFTWKHAGKKLDRFYRRVVRNGKNGKNGNGKR